MLHTEFQASEPSGSEEEDFIIFFLYTGCLKKTWTFFETAITPSFMDETFANFV